MKIIHPQKHERVGLEFFISGSVPISWITTEGGYKHDSLLLDLLNISAFVFLGASIGIDSDGRFSQKFRFNSANIPFIQESFGRIVLRLSGYSEGQSIFIPITVDGFEPDGGVSPEIIRRQEKVGELFFRYSKEINIYHQELEKIRLSLEKKDAACRGGKGSLFSSYAQDFGLVDDIHKIIDEGGGSFEDYLYSEEDKKEGELEERFKDAINWAGPIAGGSAGEINGFNFRVHSNDHGKHFHVTHRGKGVDARFSFPEIELESYKNQRNTIGSRAARAIKEYFKDPINFDRLREQFDKRSIRT